MSNKLGGSNKPLLGDDDDDDDVEAGHVAAANVNNGGVHDLDEKDEAISAVDWFSRHKWKCLVPFPSFFFCCFLDGNFWLCREDSSWC